LTILPNTKTTFTLDFEGQVPVQIRRSGRNNSEGVALSMTWWYPKIAEFDFEGYADPYIAREFHGVWGDFDVNITIDKEYTLGGSGYLQNQNEIGHGYEDAGVTVNYLRNANVDLAFCGQWFMILLGLQKITCTISYKGQMMLTYTSL
jgi:hypothetical protein